MRKKMPRYFFDLDCLKGVVRDSSGTVLPDVASARKHADHVVHELMRNREGDTRAWQLLVWDEARNLLFEIAFADFDHSLDHLQPDMKRKVDEVRKETVSVYRGLRDVRSSIDEIALCLEHGGGRSRIRSV
jgi:hypothetical protein